MEKHLIRAEESISQEGAERSTGQPLQLIPINIVNHQFRSLCVSSAIGQQFLILSVQPHPILVKSSVFYGSQEVMQCVIQAKIGDAPDGKLELQISQSL